MNPGFATSDVLLVSLEAVQRMDAKEQRTGLLAVLDRVRSVPGVQAVSSAEYNPVGRAWTHNVLVPGNGQHESVEATMAPVTFGFFETMNIPLLAGRVFVPSDMDSARASSVIVNEAFARGYFGREHPVGRTFEGRFGETDDSGVQEVVGVVADTRYDLRNLRAPPFTSRCGCEAPAPFTCVWQGIRRRSRRGCVKRSAPRIRRSA